MKLHEQLIKMPKNVKVDPDRVQELLANGGLKPDTLKKRARALDGLENFLKENCRLSVDEAIKDPSFESLLMSYFECLRVEQKDESGKVADVCPKQDIRASEIAQRKDDTDLMKSMHSLNGELASHIIHTNKLLMAKLLDSSE